MKETCRRELFLVDTQMLKCSCVVERDRKKKKDSPITFLLALYLVNIWKIQPVYDGPSVAICPSACAFVAFFLYSLKRLSSSFFTLNWWILICNMRYYTWRQNFMEKYNKISSKMYKHLEEQKEQQKVQQKVHFI